MTENEMKQYNSIDELIEARAQAQHRANLEHGGVFGADGKRFSDIEVERRVSKYRGTGYVSKEHAKSILGFKLSDGTLCARYIRNIGYVEFGGD